MKNKILPFMLIMSVVLFFSCEKKEGSKAAEAEDNSGNANISINTSTITKPGFVMPVTSSFYAIDGEDDGTEATKARWSANMTLGENIYIGEPRRLTWTDGRLLNFVEIRRENGTEGFALANQVVEGGRLAVVIDDRATLFSSPRTVDVSSTIMTRRTVVIYYPETENNGFVEIRGWDPGRERYVDQNVSYIRLSALSTRNSDIQSSILLQTALSLTAANQAVRREALLDSALLDYPDSVFNMEIFEIVNPNSEIVYPNTMDTFNIYEDD
ncbi:MAG: hypothetical protein FWD24_03175 [Treponema sp.]|nr:hypothetical protein [Treponema sp.]